MSPSLVLFAALQHCLFTATIVLLDFGHLLTIGLRSRRALAAENLFLRKQLALFQERKVRPRRADDSTRWIMATLSRMFEWRTALWNVKPDTLIRWHRIDSGCFGVGNPSQQEDRVCRRICGN